MSSVPSLIENHLENLQRHRLDPVGLSNDGYPTFIIKEDSLLPYRVSFKPSPTCACTEYKLSLNGKGHPVCHHILFVLLYYFKVSKLSIRMYHKLPPNFYESLISYMDVWLLEHNNMKILKKYRKKKPYNFLLETTQLKITKDNVTYLNPMYEYYTEEDCAICLDPLCSKDLMLCSECFNYSHMKCMARWLHRKQGCHFCRDNPTKTKKDEKEEFPELIKSNKLV